jgi:hypothetical protein
MAAGRMDGKPRMARRFAQCLTLCSA